MTIPTPDLPVHAHAAPRDGSTPASRRREGGEARPVRPSRQAILSRSLWSLPLLLLGLGGCGGNLTAGGLTGETSVTVSGDAPDPAAAPAAARIAGPDPFAGRAVEDDDDDEDDDEPEGEIEAEFLLFLEDADGGSVSLSDEELRVAVDVQGEREADAVQAVVPAARYTALRIVFTEIEIEVESGLVIDGVPVVGDLEVELEDATLTVVRPLSLDLDDGGRAELLVDLNAEAWLVAADPDLRRIAEEIFAQAVTVSVR